jgi:hypothetical protein
LTSDIVGQMEKKLGRKGIKCMVIERRGRSITESCCRCMRRPVFCVLGNANDDIFGEAECRSS